MIAESELQAREAVDAAEVVCLGPLSDEAVAQELETYGTTIPCSASMHMALACDPDFSVTADSNGQITRLRIRDKEVPLNSDAFTLEASEESLALWGRTDGEA